LPRRGGALDRPRPRRDREGLARALPLPCRGARRVRRLRARQEAVGVDGSDPKGTPDLREDLRRRGYLQNPLEKFLVGPVSSGNSILRTNLTVGARVGILSGAFLGLLVSGALLFLVPDLAHRPADALFVALLFVLLFAMTVGLFGILSGILTSLVYHATRRIWPTRKLTAFKVGVFAGGVFFVYFTFLWSSCSDRDPAA